MIVLPIDLVAVVGFRYIGLIDKTMTILSLTNKYSDDPLYVIAEHITHFYPTTWKTKEIVSKSVRTTCYGTNLHFHGHAVTVLESTADIIKAIQSASVSDTTFL